MHGVGTVLGTRPACQQEWTDEIVNVVMIVRLKRITNPEELIAAAHAGCFAMQLSHFLAENGTPATKLDAKATVTVDPDPAGGFTIKGSAIELVGTVPGIDEAKFKELADQAKAGCPVSRALGAIEVSLDARLG